MEFHLRGSDPQLLPVPPPPPPFVGIAPGMQPIPVPHQEERHYFGSILQIENDIDNFYNKCNDFYKKNNNTLRSPIEKKKAKKYLDYIKLFTDDNIPVDNENPENGEYLSLRVLDLNLAVFYFNYLLNRREGEPIGFFGGKSPMRKRRRRGRSRGKYSLKFKSTS